MANRTHNSIARPPVIVVMGHIDHGKSTLLDYIRKASVVEKEAGGITQHISAYEVTHKDKDARNRKITFLDTPGHEAFQKMRNHGAELADIAILIVSAEDGVKSQTLEALESIKRAGIPYVVAINKIDKPNANVEKVKQDLLKHEVYLEGLGGDVPCIPISAKQGTGVPELLEMMLLVADLSDLSGDETKAAEGVVIETNRDPQKGISATLLITDGTLRSGMHVASETATSPVRIIENFLGETIKEATFSSPVRVVGWNNMPEVGASFRAYQGKKEAEQAAKETPVKEEVAESAVKAEDVEEEPHMLVIPLFLKADVAGTLDAIEHEIRKLAGEDIELRIISRGVGTVTESDVKAALGSTDTIIIGFNVRVDPTAQELAARNTTEIKTFDVIYKLSEWLSEIIEKRRPRKEVEEVAGRAKVLKLFSKAKSKQVLGGRLEEGALSVGNAVRIVRQDTEVGRGTIMNLQQNRADAKKIEDGEFGAEVRAAIDIVPGDFLETFVIRVT